MPSIFLLIFSLLVILFLLILMILVVVSLLSGIVSIIFGAPYVPISRNLVKKILSFGELSSGDVLCDLGCGDGRVLISGLSDFNVSRVIGYEISPWPYFKTLFLIRYNKLKRIELFRKNCLKADISKTTFIYLYLFPKLVDKVAYKIAREGIYKTKILCVAFPINISRYTKFTLLSVFTICNNWAKAFIKL